MKRRIRPVVLAFGTLVADGVTLTIQFIRKIAVAAIDETTPVRPIYSAPGTRAALERVGHASKDSGRRRGGREAQQAGTSIEEMIRSRYVEDAAQQIVEMLRERGRAVEAGGTEPDPAVADQKATDELS